MLAAFCLPGPANKDKRARFELRQTAKPSLQGLPPGSVLIRTVAASICGTDLWGRGGCCGVDWRKPLDFLKTKQSSCGGTGHEILGEVVDSVSPCPLSNGQRVLAMVPSYIQRVTPINEKFKAETGKDASELPEMGGFCQFFVSHSCACIPVPLESPGDQTWDPRYFVMAQPLATVLHACKHLDNVIGRDVAVVGQGQNGLILTQLLAGLGARRIIALDALENRLAVSKQLKATHTINVEPGENTSIQQVKAQVENITDGAMCDVVVDMVGHQEKTIDLCAQLTKENGTVLIFGLPPALGETPMSIRSGDFVRNIRYVCSSSPGMDCFQLAVDLLEQQRFDPSVIFTHIIPFSNFPEAYDMASNYRDVVIKVLLTFDDE